MHKGRLWPLRLNWGYQEWGPCPAPYFQAPPPLGLTTEVSEHRKVTAKEGYPSKSRPSWHNRGPATLTLHDSLESSFKMILWKQGRA